MNRGLIDWVELPGLFPGQKIWGSRKVHDDDPGFVVSFTPGVNWSASVRIYTRGPDGTLRGHSKFLGENLDSRAVAESRCRQWKKGKLV